MEVLIDDPFYSALFIGVSMILFMLEIFIPSFGVIGLFALAFAALGVYGFFHQGRQTLAVTGLASLGTFMLLALRFVLRRLSLSSTLPPETTHSVDVRIDGLVGKEGVAITQLRPAGIARIDGKRVDVVATGKFIDKDKRVRVTETSGNRVVVREVPGEPPK